MFHRGAARAALLTMLALVAGLLLAPAASAHDVVTGSDPADGATLPTPPTQVSVTFDEAPQPNLAALTVVGPDGAQHQTGAVTVRDEVVSVGVGPLPVAGQYQIGYRVVSGDGHPVDGSIAFTVTTPSPSGQGSSGSSGTQGAQPAQPTPSPAAAAGPDSGSGGIPSWVFVVVALVVVAGAVALVLRRRT